MKSFKFHAWNDGIECHFSIQAKTLKESMMLGLNKAFELKTPHHSFSIMALGTYCPICGKVTTESEGLFCDDCADTSLGKGYDEYRLNQIHPITFTEWKQTI